MDDKNAGIPRTFAGIIGVIMLLVATVSTTYALITGGQMSILTKRLETLELRVQLIDIDRNIINLKLEDIKSGMLEIKKLLADHIMEKIK